MPRGAPDYSNVTAYNPLHRLDDDAELAARLGSVNVFDRAGNVIYIDTFSKGIPQWTIHTYGTGSAASVTTERAASPPFSLKMTTGSDGAHAIKAELKMPYHHDCKMGVEYSFTHHVNSLEHWCVLYHRDGATRREYFVVLDIDDGVIKVYDSDGAYKNFASGLNLKSDAFVFNQCKLVVDTENDAYVRFTFNNQTWSLEDYAPHEVSESSVPYIAVNVQFTGDAGSSRDHYLDNVIVTQNEP